MSGEAPRETRRPNPPGGMAPPETAELPDGTVVDLLPLAQEVCTRHLERHPEDVEHYGYELAFDCR